MGLGERRQREGIQDNVTIGGKYNRKESAKASKEEWPLMWENNKMCMFEDYMTLNIPNSMVSHKENHAF